MIINAHVVMAHVIDDDRPIRAFEDRADADEFAAAANACARAIDAWRCPACQHGASAHDPHQGNPTCSTPAPLNKHDPEMIWSSTEYRVEPLIVELPEGKWHAFKESL